ncbi:MAG: hypothetical protein RLZZ65_1193 [Bacteroidota bacterium]|jgi:hypothetical protein
MKTTILLSFIVLLFVGCGKIDTPTEASKAIIGKWRFVGSGGGFSGTGNSSFDNTDVYEFKENGTFKHYKGNQVIEQANFSFQLGTSIFDQEEHLMIHYANGSAPIGITQSFDISNDTLILNEEVYDGFGYTFVKQ